MESYRIALVVFLSEYRTPNWAILGPLWANYGPNRANDGGHYWLLGLIMGHFSGHFGSLLAIGANYGYLSHFGSLLAIGAIMGHFAHSRVTRTHHGTSMFWSLVKSDDFAPPSLEGVHMTHTP